MYRQSINKQMGYQSEESSSKDNQPQPKIHAKTSDTEQTQKHLQVIFNLTIIQRKSLKDEHLIILKRQHC